jgi:hypothetical protein
VPDAWDEFSARSVTLQVLEHLERRRVTVVSDEALVRAEVKQALVPVRAAYEEAQLPVPYLDALEAEINAVVPVKWQRVAAPYTDRERREFGVWRGGDPVARITFVFLGLLLGGLILAAPFIPIWEKWFPFVLSFAAWWLPDAQVAWHKRRYARALGGIALELERAQPSLEGRVSTDSLLLSDKGEPRG